MAEDESVAKRTGNEQHTTTITLERQIELPTFTVRDARGDFLQQSQRRRAALSFRSYLSKS